MSRTIRSVPWSVREISIGKLGNMSNQDGQFGKQGIRSSRCCRRTPLPLGTPHPLPFLDCLSVHSMNTSYLPCPFFLLWFFPMQCCSAFYQAILGDVHWKLFLYQFSKHNEKVEHCFVKGRFLTIDVVAV